MLQTRRNLPVHKKFYEWKRYSNVTCTRGDFSWMKRRRKVMRIKCTREIFWARRWARVDFAESDDLTWSSTLIWRCLGKQLRNSRIITAITQFTWIPSRHTLQDEALIPHVLHNGPYYAFLQLRLCSFHAFLSSPNHFTHNVQLLHTENTFVKSRVEKETQMCIFQKTVSVNL